MNTMHTYIQVIIPKFSFIWDYLKNYSKISFKSTETTNNKISTNLIEELLKRMSDTKLLSEKKKINDYLYLTSNDPVVNKCFP